MSAEDVKHELLGADGGYDPLLGSRRTALIFALTIFVTTAIQVLSIPVTALLGGTIHWGLALPEDVVVSLLVVGCAVQAGVLTLADRFPRLTIVLTVVTYLLLAIGLGIPSWLTGMSLGIAASLFVHAARASVIASCLWSAGAVVAAMGGLWLWLLLSGVGTSQVSTTGYVLGEAARFAAPAAGATALGIWWGARVRRVAAARDEATRATNEHARRVADAQQHERARIAQELHDVAGQHLAGLITLSEAALAIAPRQPTRALELVAAVRSEGRFAAASLAGALADLRAAGVEAPGGTADLLRAPELADYWRRVGMAASLHTSGSLDKLPAVVSSTAYRALQEMMTNVAKHAPGAAARVQINAHDAALEVVVENSLVGDGTPPTAGFNLGWGLTGMRERVELLHGTLEAGPVGPGWWRVRLWIPLIDDPLSRTIS